MFWYFFIKWEFEITILCWVDLKTNNIRFNEIENTFISKVEFNSARNIAKNKTSVLIQLMDEGRVVEIVEKIGSSLND